jgi:hypothetical protein
MNWKVQQKIKHRFPNKACSSTCDVIPSVARDLACATVLLSLRASYTGVAVLRSGLKKGIFTIFAVTF